MTTWEEVLLKAKSAAGTVSKKTTELADTVKLKTRSAEIQKELAATFEGMGRLLYDSRQSGEDVTPLLDESMKQVGTLQEDLRKVEDELCARKNVVRCASCHAMVDDDAAFCPHCGHKLNNNEE